MPLECCVCEYSDQNLERGLKKAQKKLPLLPKPDVLLIDFKSSYNWLCQHCYAKNAKMVECESERDDFTADEVYECIDEGRTEMAKLIMSQLMLQKKYSVCKNYKDDKQNNLLHLAAKNGYWHLARFILQTQLSNQHERSNACNEQNSMKHTPLTIACTNDNRDDMVLLFCKAGGDPNYKFNDTTCLMRACASGQDMAINILHRYGARLDDRSESSGRTALIKAAMLGELDCVRTLLRVGGDRKCRDFNGCNALQYADRRKLLDSKYVDIVRCLESADLYFERKRMLRFHHNNDSSRGISSNGKKEESHEQTEESIEFSSIKVTDVQGQQWTSKFDEISQCVMWCNDSSGVTTYTRPTSSDEVWMREQLLRDEKKRKERKEEAANWVEKWDELSEQPFWYHKVTNETTWIVPRDVKPSGWVPPNDIYKDNLKQEYFDSMGIVNSNKKKEKLKLKEEDRVYDEEGGYWDDVIYYDGYGGWYNEDGEYNDGFEEKVKNYEKKKVKSTRKRVGGKKVWKKYSWHDRLIALIEDWGLSKYEKREEESRKERERIDSGSNIKVIKGNFGIIYNQTKIKTRKEIEDEKTPPSKIPWTWTAEDEKEILKKKAENYKTMNRRK